MPRTNRKYSPEFKIEVVEAKLSKKLSFKETARRYNLFVSRNGYSYPDYKRVQCWERIYLEEGKEGFYIERRGKSSKGGRKPTLILKLKKI